MEKTRKTGYAPLDESAFIEYIKQQFRPRIREYIQGHWKELKALKEKLEIKKIIIRFFEKEFVYSVQAKLIVPDFEAETMKFIKFNSIDEYSGERFGEDTLFLAGHRPDLPTLKEIQLMQALLKGKVSEKTGILCICDVPAYTTYWDLVCCYSVHRGSIIPFNELENGYEIVSFPVIRFEDEISGIDDLINKVIIKNCLFPDFLSEESRTAFTDICALINSDVSYEEYSESEDESLGFRLKFFPDKMLRDFMKGRGETEPFKSLHWELSALLKECYEKKTLGGMMVVLSKENLLQCEYKRARIEPYEEALLTDPNRGHWDLWTDDVVQGYTVQMEDAFMARNPRCDINENGVIAIDFGTKSTVVVYQSDIDHSLPMGIGDGELSKEPSPKRYENPTIMQFVDLDSFLEAYRAKSGRPDTEWDDLPISHTAMDKFQNAPSEQYYSFLYQIKQWAGMRKKQFRIQPIKGESIVLPSFSDIEENDFNPIEIYAYYIGAYINNMRKGHGIFLDYYLSFPVTYEVKIRDKIIKSFEKGLKKSLPETILNDTEIMKGFSVKGDVSEPAAYAVCALQEYGFAPEGDDEVFYGIFDFGGGTTDFDFGLWKKSKKKRYDYRIENFGAGGDEFLGGENLLEMLAFDIFKENQGIMREKGYTFTLAPKCTEFLGSDALLADSQEAEKNMHNLMEKLRPFWEKQEVDIDVYRQQTINQLEEMISQYRKSPHIEEIEKEIRGAYVYEIEESDYRYADDYDEVLRRAMETVRDIINGDEDSCYDDTIDLKVALFNKEGEQIPNVELKTTRSHIDGFIEAKIREGIKSFFAALMLSYQSEKIRKPSTVNILLAGNSCKSPIVRKVFEEEIKLHEERIKGEYDSENQERFFEIFPPLGTREAYIKMKERGVPYKEDDFEKPTGKTGVAFGLIQCRKGGSIERVTNVGLNSEIPFQFFLGWQSKNKFELFKDEGKRTTQLGKPDYNTWYKFIEADEDTFYLYYTTLPECVNGDLPVAGNPAVKRLKCIIDITDEEAYVYIKATSPHSIQYAVSTGYDVEKDKLGEIFEKELR